MNSKQPSKQLRSILSSIPAATIEGQRRIIEENEESFPVNNSENWDAKLLARIPQKLKDEVREYIKINKGTNEQILILKGLKAIGFHVADDWLIDRRKNR